MVDNLVTVSRPTGKSYYTLNTSIRGSKLSIKRIRDAVRELEMLNKEEGRKAIAKLKIGDGETEKQFSEKKEFLLDDAFRITVSIEGYKGKNVYGENENVFDSPQLPSPIKMIYFTNETAYSRNANGDSPPNRLSFKFNFDKPQIFDPSISVSQPTPNDSEVSVLAHELGFFGAVENIVNQLNTPRRWHSLIHGRFTYDVGLWFLFMPLALFFITILANHLLTFQGDQITIRIAFFVFCLGVSLMVYRGLFDYMRWVFPVIALEENKDSATRHRLIFSGIISFIFFSSLVAIVNKFLKDWFASVIDWLF